VTDYYDRFASNFTAMICLPAISERNPEKLGGPILNFMVDIVGA
jgi:hypothetical protein